MYNPLLHYGGATSANADVTRRFLLKSAMLVTAALALPALPEGAVAAPLSQDQKSTLLRMARDIYPHDGFLDDAPYQAVIDAILTEAEGDPKVAHLLSQGLADLEARSQAIHKTAYVAISKPEEREGVLRSIELTDFFQKIKGGLLMGLYNNKALWPKFGYDGSSWEMGGFIDKGFDKIDWL